MAYKRKTKDIDLLGQRFGRLVVVGPMERLKDNDGAGRSRRHWPCLCDCGAQRLICQWALLTGNTAGCGSCNRGTHRKSRTPTYAIWAGIIRRGTWKSDKRGASYEKRGITVCDRWREFENFLADMGERPSGLSIDRIDNNKGYEPGNCRWATAKQQAQNRSDNRLSFEAADEIRALYAGGMKKAQIARRFAVSFHAICKVIDGTRWVRDAA